MWRKAFNGVLEVLFQTPSWVMLLAGIVTVAATLLVGPYLENRQLDWQRQVIQQRATVHDSQRQAYDRMLVALKSDDPILLQRLAYHYLRLKPTGARLLTPTNPTTNLRAATTPSPTLAPLGERVTTIETWMAQGMPPPPVLPAPQTTLDARLVRLTTGPLRPMVAAAGALAIALGLVPLVRKRQEPITSPLT